MYVLESLVTAITGLLLLLSEGCLPVCAVVVVAVDDDDNDVVVVVDDVETALVDAETEDWTFDEL